MKGETLSNRNSGLDFLRFICAFFVICIHVFPVDIFWSALIRVAVPVFFMITGYFYSLTKSNGREKNQIVKIFKIFLGANILYFVIEMVMHINDIGAYLRSLCSFDVLFDFGLLNASPFNGNMWYLGALLYVLVLVYLLEKKWDRKALYPVVPLLILAELALGKYSLLVFGAEFPVEYSRNFLLVGLPCFLIGDMIFRYKIQFNKILLIISCFLFYITTLFENYLLKSFDLNATRENYMSTLFLAITVFLLGLQCNSNKAWFNKIAYWGRKYTLLIYILHSMVLKVADESIKKVGEFVPEIIPGYKYILPFIVLIGTMIFAWLVKFIERKLKKEV